MITNHIWFVVTKQELGYNLYFLQLQEPCGDWYQDPHTLGRLLQSLWSPGKPLNYSFLPMKLANCRPSRLGGGDHETCRFPVSYPDGVKGPTQRPVVFYCFQVSITKLQGSSHQRERACASGSVVFGESLVGQVPTGDGVPCGTLDGDLSGAALAHEPKFGHPCSRY